MASLFPFYFLHWQTNSWRTFNSNKKSLDFLYAAFCCQKTCTDTKGSDHCIEKRYFLVLKKYCHNVSVNIKSCCNCDQRTSSTTHIQLWFESFSSFLFFWWFGHQRFGDVCTRLHCQCVCVAFRRHWATIEETTSLPSALLDMFVHPLCFIYALPPHRLVILLSFLLLIFLFFSFCQRIAVCRLSWPVFFDCCSFVGLSLWLALFKENRYCL